MAADGKMSYTDCAPPAEVLEQFHTRNDNQIASLEMLAIAYGERCAPGCVCAAPSCVRLCSGLATFKAELRGRRVVVHSDNTIAEHGMWKGRARSFDHTAVVHSVW